MGEPEGGARAEAVVDLTAIRHNVQVLLAATAPGAALMIVVKADGYGHGALPVAQAALAAGASWLGVCTLEEALELRAGVIDAPVLSWLHLPDEDFAPAIRAGVDLGVSSRAHLAGVLAGARRAGRPARLHLKIDTGLTRNGAAPAEWDRLLDDAVRATADGTAEVVAVWSHLAAADEPGHPATARQLEAFQRAYEEARIAGLEPALRHLGNSAAALVVPEAWFDLVRVGIAAYGIDPAPGLAAQAGITLQPVMRLRAQLANVKPIAAGDGVSYGWTWIADQPTTVGLVPLGYGDGVPRHASSKAEVQVGEARARILGRVCMDQFVVAVPAGVAAGDEVVLFGSGADGGPTAQDWAEACGTISYEIVTRIGGTAGRAERRWTRE